VQPFRRQLSPPLFQHILIHIFDNPKETYKQIACCFTAQTVLTVLKSNTSSTRFSSFASHSTLEGQHTTSATLTFIYHVLQYSNTAPTCTKMQYCSVNVLFHLKSVYSSCGTEFLPLLYTNSYTAIFSFSDVYVSFL
jgi:hypothetical protein